MIIEPIQHLAVPVDSLNLDPANARRHDAKNITAIRASLEKFGQRSPIVVQNQGRIVRSGNGRFIAARELEKDEIEVVIVNKYVQATAWAIVDNRSGELATWLTAERIPGNGAAEEKAPTNVEAVNEESP